jgi:hypothetical protein
MKTTNTNKKRLGREAPDRSNLKPHISALRLPQDPYMTGPEHNFAWNTIPDMRGGLTQLTEVFEEFVVSNLQ